MIAIFCALDEEYHPLCEAFHANTSVPIPVAAGAAGLGRGRGSSVLVIRSLIGKLSAGQCAAWCLDTFPDCHLLLSVGIAGALNPALQIGDVVVGDSVIDYCNEKAERIDSVPPKSPLDFHPFEKELTYQGRTIVVRPGTVLSSDEGIGQSELRDRLYEEHGGDCVEMESAGVADVAQRYRRPFYVCKTISDRADSQAALSAMRSVHRSMGGLARLLSALV